MKEKEVLDILNRTGAVIADSHIVYTSGKHGTAYINKDAIYPHTEYVSILCNALAAPYWNARPDVDVVIAPAVGGVILSQWIAYCLTNRGRSYAPHKVLGVYAEKADDGDTFVIKRGYDKLIPGKNVLVAEDVLNTGGSAKKVVDAVRALHGNVVGVVALCNRGGVTAADLGDVPSLYSLVSIQMDAWDEADCPLCAQGVRINTNVGKGREFLARKQA